jgi:hypothetical protein
MCSGFSTGSSMRADSAPRTQYGTLTGMTRTLLSPAPFICSADHAMARSSDGEPLSRLPMR